MDTNLIEVQLQKKAPKKLNQLMKHTTHFKSMPSHLKPREKALTFGVDSLTDIELLAIIIRNGSKSLSVLEVATKIMRQCNSLSSIKNLAMSDLMKIEGIGKVKALEIKSLFEFARRFSRETKLKISNDEEAASYASSFVKSWERESFLVLVLGSKGKIIYCQNLYDSHSNGISIEPNEILSLVLKTGQKSFYCFHNHPSGNANPSEDDTLSTERLTYLSSLMGLNLLGHIILTEDGNFKKIKTSLE